MNNLKEKLRNRGIAYILTGICHNTYDCPVENIDGMPCPIYDKPGQVCEDITWEIWEEFLATQKD